MPPEGYVTVSLREEAVEEIEKLVEAGEVGSVAGFVYKSINGYSGDVDVGFELPTDRRF